MSLQKKREQITLLLTLVVFSLVMINASLFSFRFDLTSTGSFSIAQASKDVVAQAKENIYLTYYISKKLSAYDPSLENLSDFLEKYAVETGNRVKVKVVDPQDTGELNDMQRLGLEGKQMQVVEESQASQTLVFNGIVINYLDRQETLSWIDALESLEYSITDRVNRLVNKKTKKIGFINGEASRTLENSFRLFSRELSEIGVIKTINPDESIEPDIDVLVVAGNTMLDEAKAYQIDQFIMKGGKAFLALDSIHIDLNQPSLPVNKVESNPVLKLVEHWGVKLEPVMLLDEYNNLISFGNRLERYAAWPKILVQNTSRTNPITRRFAGLTLMWPSPLILNPQEELQIEELVWSSPKSWLMKDRLSADPMQARISANLPDVDRKSYPCIVSISGIFPSAYTKETIPKKMKDTPHVAQSTKTRLVVSGSSSFFTDLTGNDTTNVLFVENIVEWLAQEEDLLSIKTRAFRDHSLNLLQDTKVRQSMAFFLSFVNLFLVPLAILTWSVVRLLRRRKRENKN